MKNAVLFIVDVQNDFLPGGALPVPEGDQVIPVINRLTEKFTHVWASKDWHPARSLHFDQWPVHCVRGTEGAAFPKSLRIEKIEKIFLKGTAYADDGYSAFEASNEDLESVLKIKKIDTLYITGLATDYCVKATAMDAVRKGFRVFVIKEAVRAVNVQPEDEQKALNEMQKAGIKIIHETEI